MSIDTLYAGTLICILIILQQMWIKPAGPIEFLIRFSIIPAVPPSANRLRLLPKVLPDFGGQILYIAR